MIQRSTAIAATALVLSLVLHLVGLDLSWPDLQLRPQEEERADVVRMGNAFEDFTDSRAEAVAPEPEPDQAPEPEPAQTPDTPVDPPVEPEPAEPPTSDAKVASVNPQRVYAPDAGMARAVPPDSTGPSQVPKSGTPEPETTAPVGGDAGTSPDPSQAPPVTPAEQAQTPRGTPEATAEAATAAPTPPTQTAQAPADTSQAQIAEPQPSPAPAPAPEQLAALAPPVAPVSPAVPAPVTPSTQPSVIPVTPPAPEVETPPVSTAPAAELVEPTQDAPDDSGSAYAVAASPRPKAPPRRDAETARGVEDGNAAPSDVLTRPTETIESPLLAYRRGERGLTFRPLSGSQSGGFGQADVRGPGNATETNYAGRVLMHLNHTPVVYVSQRGFARVFFEIAPDGSLAWVDVVDSSGSPEVNKAAKDQVRRAAPFPRPPQGRSRKLAFYYQIN